MRTFEENLALYARLAIRRGVNLQPGQELLLAADIGDAALVRLLVDEAYEAGSKNVATLYSDQAVTLSRFKKGSEEAIAYAPGWWYDGVARAMGEGAARLGVASSDPALLRSVEPSRVAVSSKAQAEASMPVAEMISAFRINWSVIGAASPSWAERVFPGEPIETAVAKLWDAIFMVSKVLEPDPIAAWDAHADGLEARQNWLNERRFTAVHFLGAGTDLMVGLAEGAVWKGGWGHAQNGVKCAPNIPTEEIFTAPHRARVDGVVRSTKPLSNRGQIIDGIEMEFKDGVAVRASASAGEEALIRLLDTDEGARRLGEVALVPASSGVSRSGLLWLNTLYDENAACHIALGRCYSENFDGALDKGKDELTALGGNDSVIHVDWMIGSAEVAVTGIGADGSRTPILAGGDWAF